ncbi:serine hydrolase [Defluviimonas sp. WL0050]|uniref:Serine hydrolase n=1 Tax=Albidovulum litorale TaxID=2984134 RepID=A0ABT2ZL16_9RHOB|nr:serine hydrolase [Defluviimonas sp. WL0050]MCV2871824.1 serine hydrolase [Defluviimonas sp. WL0050]
MIAVAFALVCVFAPVLAIAAPYADFVIDARTGEVLHQDNADTRLHPASLTKMMTLYIAFEAIERGEITLDSKVTISKHAASQPPSKLGLRPGQTIALRYLIRAAAIKSANDAATAIGEAIEGSEPAFAKRMNRTAKALGMTRTTFVNANGLTAKGHLSTARDMTTLGRHVFYDFPQYYNLFSRTTADAGVARVAHTNRRFLAAYKGADGIKTGYTAAAGFNLTASAQRGNKRIIATVFGGKSTATRNARVAELMDLGFGKAPNRVAVQKPARPVYVAEVEEKDDEAARILAEAVTGSTTMPAGKVIRLNTAVKVSPRPKPRPTPAAAPAPEDVLIAMQGAIETVVAEVQPASTAAARPEPKPEALAEAVPTETDAATAAVEVAAGTEAEAETELAAAQEPAEPAFVQSTKPQPETLAAVDPTVASAPEAEATPAEDDDAIAMALAMAVAAAPLTEAEPAPTVEAEPVPATETVLVEAVPAAEAAEPTLLQPTVSENGTAQSTEPQPEQVVLASLAAEEPETEEPLEVVTRVSTSGGRQWSINVGHFSSRYNAERQLLQTALIETNTLEESLRKVVARRGGYDANFVGMTEEMAALACRRLQARQTECTVVGP